ncbi:MAG: endonuclease/exonuclease/phosphatase family protein [Paludibacter sp.]|nr:endonuclease/exonuclease/phosphatase family protein [Bacteroidales bacterium]MCM1068441.1 endonuclease/exonuclease/phosphatase family protein [Prevotella sp.]MCM1353395.1 endonuclease/exonuclease/phosphatase family protein [Bacteroides sp.]MCM1442556.1 endonuclease/exonuclease/phosphatase family protein [Muribaculum sp.]MCM1481401.1 endonuclease/exonuclease/phosphatase family protein [Paludibacter sp.]
MKTIRYILGRCILVLNWLAVLVLLLAVSGQFIPPTYWSFPALCGIGFEWLIAVHCLFAGIWICSHHKKLALISLVSLLCSLVPIRNTFAFPHTKHSSAKTTHTLSILSYNSNRLDQFKKPQQNKILPYLKALDADIVCLQEFETNKDSRFLTLHEVKRYLSQYPYSYIDFKLYKGKRQYGLAVFSKYPLINKQTLPYQSTGNISNRCDVVIGKDTLRLLNNHLESNKFTEEDVSALTQFSNRPEYTIKTSTLRVVRKMRKAYQYRSNQADVLCQEIENSPYPVIICGDFNDVPVSYLYRTVSTKLSDAFIESCQCGTGHTLYKKGIGIRIDYILHSKQVQASDFQIDKLPYSDHYPIRCTLSW